MIPLHPSPGSARRPSEGHREREIGDLELWTGLLTACVNDLIAYVVDA
jgi:hypothetical protein